MDPLLTPEQVAKILGLELRTVYRYIQDGDLPAVNIGRGRPIWRVDRVAFKRWLEARGWTDLSGDPDAPDDEVD